MENNSIKVMCKNNCCTVIAKMIIECKASEEKLDEKVFEQIARYNLSLKVDYLWVTNGKFNFCCKLKNGIELLNEIPSVEEISRQ